MKMNQWIILLINLLILIVPSQQTHPHYSYVCKEDGSIDIHGIKDPGSVSVVKILYYSSNTSTAVNCTEQINVDKGKAIIPKSCFNNTFISEGDNRTVHILVYDPALFVTTTTVPPTKTVTNITGGIQSNQYIMKCNGVPITGVKKTVVGRFNAKLEEEIPSRIIETSNIQMTFRGTGVANDPSISSLYIGDSFYMFLRYSGELHYTLDPYLCTAFEGNRADARANNITLWENQHSGSCVTNDALAYKIVESTGFVYESSTVVKVHLFAFHFTSSDYITIECTVNLKPHTSKTPGNKVCEHNSGRRRRDSPSSETGHQYTVHSTLKVRNKPDINKGNSIIQSWTIMSSVILSGVLVMKGL